MALRARKPSGAFEKRTPGQSYFGNFLALSTSVRVMIFSLRVLDNPSDVLGLK